MTENTASVSFPILVVEDNPVTRKILEKNLTRAGYHVSSMGNGREALEAFKDRFFPIVLSDWLMPDMDGIQLCRAIREKSLPGYVFFILLTSKDSKDDIVQGLNAGADDYLTKPVLAAELMARIRTGIRILELEKSLKSALEEIKTLSVTDPLTGCYNRRYLQVHLPKEIQRSRRYRRPLSIILCDIDHFKRINDTHGHTAGDKVLKSLAHRLAGLIRKDIDWVSRFGGEEFLLVFPETDCRSALRAAERLRKAIAEKAFDLDGRGVRVTASFGITGVEGHAFDEAISFDALISEADHHLYEAKKAGRNRARGAPYKENTGA